MAIGGVVWAKNDGRSVDPFGRKGYKQPAQFKLCTYTDGTKTDYLYSFHCQLVNYIATIMTKRGHEQPKFGPYWEVMIPCEIYMFFGYNIAILIMHTGGPKGIFMVEAWGLQVHVCIVLGP